MQDLSLLSGPQLEHLYHDSVLSDDDDLGDAVVAQLLQLDHVPRDYGLLWVLQDLGWGGGSSQEDRDSR